MLGLGSTKILGLEHMLGLSSRKKSKDEHRLVLGSEKNLIGELVLVLDSTLKNRCSIGSDLHQSQSSTSTSRVDPEHFRAEHMLGLVLENNNLNRTYARARARKEY